MNLPWIIAENSLFKKDFINAVKGKLEECKSKKTKLVVMDFGSGDGNFKREMESEFGSNIEVLNVDFSDADSKSKPDINAAEFLKPKFELESFQNHFDIIFSHTVFHELAKDAESGDRDGGINDPISRRVLQNLYLSLKPGGLLMIYDDIACSFGDYVQHGSIVLSRDKYLFGPQIFELLAEFTINYYKLNTDQRVEKLKLIAKSIKEKTSIDYFDFLKELFIDFPKINKAEAFNSWSRPNKYFLAFRYYLEHHGRCTFDNYITEIEQARFVRLSTIQDSNKGLAQFIFSKAN